MPSFLDDAPLARKALAYASEQHLGQHRDSDKAPFILHPLEVASLLRNTGHDETVVAAGILHDTIEDTASTPSDIDELFGEEVAGLVAALTEDEAIEAYEERKSALRRQILAFGDDAFAVYAADKVAKVRELRAQITPDPTVLRGNGAERAKLDHYIKSLAMLEHERPGHPLVRQLRFELEALQALPPRGEQPRVGISVPTATERQIRGG